MGLYETARNLPHDAVVNVLDLIAFVLITPEVIGERRHQAFTAWLVRLFGGEKRRLLIILSVAAAGAITRSLGILVGHGRFLALLCIAALLLSLFVVLGRLIRTAPSRRLLLGLGASIFVAARLTAIFFVL